MSQNLSVNSFKWVENTVQFNEDFRKNYNEENSGGYFLEVDVRYLETLHDLHNDLAFSPRKMKIEKIEKIAANVNEKEEYTFHMKNIKETSNHGLVLQKVHRVIKFNQKA